MKKKRKVFRIRMSSKLKGAYAETDLDRGTITINKKYHKSHPLHKKRYPEMLDTRVHEAMHAQHPKMYENTVRKLTNHKVKRLSKKQKQKVYGKTLIIQNTNHERK